MPISNLKKVKGIRMLFDGKRSFTFIIGEGLSSENSFLTNENIRQLIQKHALNNGAEIGEISFSFFSKERIANWETYYPVNKSQLKVHLETTTFQDFFKKGINQELERMALKRLKKSNPRLSHLTHKISFRQPVSSERIEQLEKRGISEKEMYEGYSYRRARRVLSKKINRDKRKAKLARRPLVP